MGNTIAVDDLINEIGMNFIDPPVRNTIIANINSIIHRINSMVGKKNVLLKITGEGGYWENITTNWEDITTNWEDLGIVTDGFTYDVTEFKLTIPQNIDKIQNFWVDDYLWIQKSYEVVKTDITYNNVYFQMNNNIYCQVGNDVFFSRDITIDSPTIKAQVYQNYPDIKDGYVTLDYDFRSTLVSGAISMLAVMQKYLDKDLYAVHSRIFDDQLDKMRSQTNTADSPDILNYGGADDLLTTVGDIDDYCLRY